MQTFSSWLSFPGTWSYSPLLSTTTIASTIPLWIAQQRLLCTNTENLKISRLRLREFENFSSSTFHEALLLSRLCKHDETEPGGDAFLFWQRRILHVRCHFSVTVWKHDNQSSGHAFLYVRSARILMYKKVLMCIYTSLYARILVNMHKS